MNCWSMIPSALHWIERRYDAVGALTIAILGASAIQIIHMMDTCVQLQGGHEDVGAIRNPR
jgi:hypothetical protein